MGNFVNFYISVCNEYSFPFKNSHFLWNLAEIFEVYKKWEVFLEAGEEGVNRDLLLKYKHSLGNKTFVSHLQFNEFHWMNLIYEHIVKDM